MDKDRIENFMHKRPKQNNRKGKKGKQEEETVSFMTKKVQKQGSLMESLRRENHALPQTKKISKKEKVAVLFDEQERDEYLKGYIGARKKRQEEFNIRKEAAKKKLIDEQKDVTRKRKQEQVKKYNEILEKNNEFLASFDKEQNRVNKTENITTQNNTEVEVKIQYL